MFRFGIFTMPRPKAPSVDRYCLVCGEKIKVHECIHYGALSCYSCRAFFRYDKCLSVGMRPDLVLTEEEKQKRFGLADQESRGNGNAGFKPISADVIAKHHKGEDEAGHASASFQTCDGVESNIRNRTKETDMSGIHTLEYLRKAYNICSRRILDGFQGKQLVSSLLALHYGDGTEQMQHSHGKLFQLFARLHFQIHKSFAQTIAGFKSLPLSDQDQLLKQNAKMHLAFVIAGYLAAGSGWEQAQWLAGESTFVSELGIEETGNLRFLPTELFFHGSAAGKVAKLCNAIAELLPMGQSGGKKCEVAVALLFCQDGLTLKANSVAQLQCKSYQGIVQTENYMTTPMLEKLKLGLLQLVDIVDGVHGPSLDDITMQHICMPFSNEEEARLQNQLRRFDHEFHSVPFGVRLLEGIIRTMTTVQGDPRMLKEMIAVHAQRVLRILCMHDEFNGLCTSAQNALFHRGSMRFQALLNLTTVKAPSPIDQLHCVIGYQDMEYMQAVKEEIPEPVSMLDLEGTRDLLNKISHPGLVEQYLDLHIRLKPLVSAHEMFQMLALVCLFAPSPTGTPTTHSDPVIKMLCQQYVTVMERRNGLDSSRILKIVDCIDRMSDLFYLLF